ncbi:MAG: NUDIX domain-containing protein [Candidatus Sumerlaeaceae bacterium]|nr:NUDIX domain-containing protein [Candidatus Sumerlaeaceae bacterium]
MTPSPDYNDPMELLAMVNEDNEECGAAPRQLIHELGLLHRAVHVLVYVSERELIIQRRSPKKDTFPLRWECVGGHLGPGEDYESAAWREIEEELGVKALKLDYLGQLSASVATGQEFIKIYRATASPPFCPNPEEIDEISLVTEDELVRLVSDNQSDFSPVFLETLRAVGLLRN